MSIQDAVDLVLLALERMKGGEVFIPKGVDRCSVGELALNHHPDWDWRVVGKRSYEKQNEVLVSADEVDRLRDCGDVYVLLPEHIRWEPKPYGVGAPRVAADFEYRSDR
jgi:UDP-N-acetylglucosamine 4,6-dehydratase